ncbi:MAG: peptidoglycan DD-metalloendopeptidase family protein [Bdellovibrionales bacterium]|nr:peptidoglycan DD-metalloendopeptidase family protein [Bdellovibrionales bacterium]
MGNTRRHRTTRRHHRYVVSPSLRRRGYRTRDLRPHHLPLAAGARPRLRKGLLIVGMVTSVVLLGLYLRSADVGVVRRWLSALHPGAESRVVQPPLIAQEQEPFFPQPGPSNSIALIHVVKRGDTLGSIAERYSLPSTTVEQLHRGLAELGTKEAIPTQLHEGQVLEMRLGTDGLLRGLTTEVDAARKVTARIDANGVVSTAIEELPKRSAERMVAGLVESSFAAAAKQAGVSYEVVDDLVDLFSNRVSFHRDFRKGDRFSLIYRDTVLEDGTSLKPGPILAAALQIGGKNLVAVRYVGSDGVERYFDERGELIGNSFLRYPLKFSRISSYFTTSRFHPVLKRRRPHNGVDFAAPTGTPVRTVADGKVSFAGKKGGGGLTIKIQHNDRYSTAYLHLSKIAKGLRKGSTVKRGEVIGAVGMTGLATGPHLHYSLYDRGKYVDPLKAELPNVEVLGKGTKVAPEYLRRVLFTLEHYQKIDLSNFYWG